MVQGVNLFQADDSNASSALSLPCPPDLHLGDFLSGTRGSLSQELWVHNYRTHPKIHRFLLLMSFVPINNFFQSIISQCTFRGFKRLKLPSIRDGALMGNRCILVGVTGQVTSLKTWVPHPPLPSSLSPAHSPQQPHSRLTWATHSQTLIPKPAPASSH